MIPKFFAFFFFLFQVPAIMAMDEMPGPDVAALSSEVSGPAASVRVGCQTKVSHPKDRPGLFKTMLAVGVGEGLVMLNAGFASEYPGVYGGLLTLTSPLVASAHLNDAGNLAAVISVIALGQYNFNYVSNREDAKNRRAWVTFLGIHAIGAIGVAVDRLTGGSSCRKQVKQGLKTDAGWSVSAYPAERGAALMLARRF